MLRLSVFRFELFTLHQARPLTVIENHCHIRDVFGQVSANLFAIVNKIARKIFQGE